MTQICPVCFKGFNSKQNRIECSVCKNWVHHGNRSQCSNLTDIEFQEHLNDVLKYFECDNCLSIRYAKDSNSIFSELPFDIECKENDSDKHDPRSKPDVSSMSSGELDRFIKHCKSIQDQLYSSECEDNRADNLLSPSLSSKYVDIKSFNSNVKHVNAESSLGLFHVNIASLNLHCDDLRFVLSRLNHNFDVLGITEHKLSVDCDPLNNIDIPGYNFIYEPTLSSCGGAGFYIKNSVDFIVRDDLKMNQKSDHEAIFIELILQNRKNLIVGCIYRHAGSNLPLSDFTNLHLEPILEKISLEKKDCALMGDFNVDLIKSNVRNKANEFYNTFTSYFFSPFILHPSRLASKSLIDNIFFNSLEYSSISGNILFELSDHLIQFLVLEDFKRCCDMPVPPNLWKRDFSNFNEREFEEMVINGTDWNALLSADPNISFNAFHDRIVYHLDEIAPYKKVSGKEYRLMTKPWISESILKRCEERDNILKRIKNESDSVIVQSLRQQYKTLRNGITSEKRLSKKNFYANLFERNKKKSSEIWNCVRSLVNVSSSKSSTIKLLKNNSLLSDPNELSNIFNDYFSTLGSKVQEKIHPVKGSFKSYLDKKQNNERVINPDGHVFFLNPTTSHEVADLIKNLDEKKSTGPNGAPVFLLKKFKGFFSKILSTLVLKKVSFQISSKQLKLFLFTRKVVNMIILTIDLFPSYLFLVRFMKS